MRLYYFGVCFAQRGAKSLSSFMQDNIIIRCIIVDDKVIC